MQNVQENSSVDDNNCKPQKNVINSNKNLQLARCVDAIKSQNSRDDYLYGKAQKYYSEQPPTVNGMLGGLGYISSIDIQGSRLFLRELKNLNTNRALDCGAGIGRVTKNLLMPIFNTVDLVEQDSKFAEKARDYCVSENEATKVKYPERFGDIYNTGLQNFNPIADTYDLIWCQWVLTHLTDEDLLKFLKRARCALKSNGYFVLKENVTTSNRIEKDDADGTMTRPLDLFEKILHTAGFRLIKTMRQLSFPKGLYPVYMIACRSKVDT